MKKQSKSFVFWSVSLGLLIFLPSFVTIAYGYEDEWNINEGDIFEYELQVSLNSTESNVLLISNITFQIEVLNLTSEEYHSRCELEYTPLIIGQDDFNYTDRMLYYDDSLPSFSLSMLVLSKSYMDGFAQTYWNASYYADDLYDPEAHYWDNYEKYQNLTVHPYGVQYCQDLDPDNMMGWQRLEYLELYTDLGVLKQSQYNITSLNDSFSTCEITLIQEEDQKSITAGADFVVFSGLAICFYIGIFRRNQKKK